MDKPCSLYTCMNKQNTFNNLKVPHLTMRHFSDHFTWKHIKIGLKDSDYGTGWTTQGIVVDIQRGKETSVFSASVRPSYTRMALTFSSPNSTTGFVRSAGSAKVLSYCHLKQSFRVRGAVIPLLRTISLRAAYETHESHSPLHIHTLTYHTRTNKETNGAVVLRLKSLS